MEKSLLLVSLWQTEKFAITGSTKGGYIMVPIGRIRKLSVNFAETSPFVSTTTGISGKSHVFRNKKLERAEDDGILVFSQCHWKCSLRAETDDAGIFFPLGWISFLVVF